MPLLKDGRIIEDPWRHLDDAESLPDGQAATVSLPRWTAEREALSRRPGRLGLRLPNDASPLALADDLSRFDLVTLAFPRFTDGRGYSQARLLRGRLGFRGELRATGNVLRDQLPFMVRCGFDSFESEQKGFADALAGARTLFSVVYQPAEDGRTPVSVLRRGHRVSPELQRQRQ